MKFKSRKKASKSKPPKQRERINLLDPHRQDLADKRPRAVENHNVVAHRAADKLYDLVGRHVSTRRPLLRALAWSFHKHLQLRSRHGQTELQTYDVLHRQKLV